ncbi:Fe-S cluster biogenesis protein NfuA [Lewinella aquimaris]|uniref:Fe-S cluster biogenesis protein NfuA n=1 Tax=Neolewinella aquimaris TaxID=1835722 RepID=A0A840DY99_9BACT|nr:NifU family protein [Neolewinella aquimaris]MBB4078214.1 Fe-S cluster biogenesis protein NfuA [Neolewinella aquimaris]
MTIEERKDLITRVDSALDEVRPHLAIDGGNIEVLNVSDDKIVEIKWLGACNGCSMTAMTMKAGVEQTLKNRLPQITGVVAVN